MNRLFRISLRSKVFKRNYESNPNNINRPYKEIDDNKIQELNKFANRGVNRFKVFPEEYEPWKLNYYGDGMFLFALFISYYCYYEYIQYLKYVMGISELPKNIEYYN